MKALLIVAMMVVPPFVQPTDQDRVAALGNVSSLSREWQEALTAYPEDFAPVADPADGDWLDRRQELGQTFLSYLRSPRNLPTAARRTLYLLPLSGDLELDDAAVVLSRFLRLRVKVMAPVDLASLHVPGRRGWKGQTQLQVERLADALGSRVPGDALGLVAVTDVDLFRHADKAYTYGYSRPLERVAVVGTARFASDDPQVEQRRFLATLIHEAGHQLGLLHCIYYACLMNGSNGVDESDARPLHLCPVCLRKLGSGVRFSPLKRYRQLESSFRARGLHAEADWFAVRVARMEAGR